MKDRDQKEKKFIINIFKDRINIRKKHSRKFLLDQEWTEDFKVFFLNIFYTQIF